MIDEVLKTIKKYNLIEEDDSIIVALSGGADSVFLLVSLLELKEKLKIKKICACHLNHNLRETAKRDEDFVKNLCEKYNVPLYIKSVDIKKIKEEKKVSEEDAGRTERYKFFNEIKEKYNYNKCATAHNKDDQAETFLMRVLRGAGCEGLTSIKPIREDNVIRPILNIEKKDIINFLQKNNIDFVTDETNFKKNYLRNKIRLMLIPYLKENFNFSYDVITDIIDNLSKDSLYFKEEVSKYLSDKNFKDNKFTIEISKIKDLNEAILSRIIIESVKKLCNFNLSKKTVVRVISLIREGKTGKEVPLNNKYIATVSYNLFVIKEKETINKFCYKLKIGDNFIKEANVNLFVSKSLKNSKNSVNVSSCDNLYARQREEKDKIFIKGINKEKKIKDIFIDKKIPRDMRYKIPVITEDNKIVWVMGLYKNENKDCLYNIEMRKTESGKNEEK